MAQKTKVKELVGRGLNSYHTKALQQMDRIEKKNKEQNHKISILSNELDNDYLTKTEEGSVISLEHSKEGMVYLDELQGNTMVNYCTDGSKEMTLNGDIDAEGTFVTTTEGVDNGKVDVMCEGNTLVNLSDINTVILTSGHERITNLSKIKPNTKYTQIIRVLENSLKEGNERSVVAVINETDRNTKYSLFPQIDIMKNFVGIKKQVFTTPSTIDSIYTFGTQVRAYTINTSGNIKIQELLIEGEFDETLPYFEGMKSVGELEENKIEILSNNKNILSPVKGKKHPFFIKKGTKLVLSEKNNTPSLGGNVKLIDINENVQWFAIDAGTTTQRTITTNNDIYYIENALGGNLEYQVEIGTTRTPYVPYAMNKKEILMNEPLRGLPSNDNDKIVKIGGKYYIERNVNEVEINSLEGLGSVSEPLTTNNVTTSRVFIAYEEVTALLPNIRRNTGTGDIMCDKLPYKVVVPNMQQENQIAIGKTNAGVSLRLNGSNTEECESWLNNNPLKISYALVTPVYEPLEIEPTLNTYNDITHISNNSIIPCTMKIKNTGYNAIIKPSTLYTVALDTNKSGTIGLNLGGAKITTTNNVATITTPATLTDDSLRLYGKGIKGSKVRLLEGDKTNWIPSFFEGMKSSFEDKLQSDGTYKMEILSNNENLFDLQRLITSSNNNTIELIENGFIMTVPSGAMHSRVNYKLQNLNKNKTYRLSYKVEVLEYKEGANIDNDYIGYCTGCKNYPLKSNNYTSDIVLSNTTLGFHNSNLDGITKVKFYDMQIKEVGHSTVNNFTPYKSNKIQFSSIEPLRGINDSVRDKFVFKDNKLMIERNVTERIINGTEVINPNVVNDKVVRIAIAHKGNQYKDNKLIKCDGFPSNGDTQSMETAFVATDVLVLSIYKHRLKDKTAQGFINWLKENPQRVQFKSVEPTYEEIPYELQKIILEGYENGTLFLDTNIPPTATVTYAGETPIAKATKLNKTEVSNNTADINDNILPYLMDMDYRIVMLQLATEELEGEVSMARLFGGTYEMIKRDILSKRLTREEYGYRLADYYNAGKLTEEQVRELEELR